MAGASSCGGSTHETIVARVGDTDITQASVAHWASIVSVHRHTAGPGMHQATREALELLIARQWLLAEADEEGIRVSEREIHQALDHTMQTLFPGGDVELKAYLSASGETRTDLVTETRAELAYARLQQAIDDQVPKVTQAQVVAYYRQHKQRFAIPARLELLIANRKSAAKAERLIGEVHSGRSFATLARPDVRTLPSDPKTGSLSALETAMRHAAPDKLTGPIKQQVFPSVYDYFVFVIKRVLPAAYERLSRVRVEIGTQLESRARHQLVARLLTSWRTRLMATTSCREAYVVPKCRQYRGLAPPKEPLSPT